MHTTNDSTPPTLVERVQARRAELRLGLNDAANGKSTRADIEAALASIEPMLTGDLDKRSDMVSRDMTHWLEANKYVGVNAARPAPHEAAAIAFALPPTGKADDSIRIPPVAGVPKA